MLVMYGVSRLAGTIDAQVAERGADERCLRSCDVQRHHRIGDDVLREMLRKRDLSEADLGGVK